MDLHGEMISRMLEGARLRGEELTSRLAKARDVRYWEALNPSLSVGQQDRLAAAETVRVGPSWHSEALEQFTKHGYFRAEPILPGLTTSRMREGVEVVRREGWPAVFAFLYDEFWLASRTPAVAGLLSAILGPGYGQVPHLWVHYVSPHRGATGWPPHVEGRRKPKRVNVWIPLSDATLDNGCMWVIPKDLVPARLLDAWHDLEVLDRADGTLLLQGGRALPSVAGAVLGWGFDVIHWGSTCAAAGSPRIAISQEFIAREVVPANDELPLLDPRSELPALGERLHAIGRGILTYEKYEPLMAKYAGLAEHLVSRPDVA